MSGFKFRKTISGGNGIVPAEFELIGGNSVVFQVGDLIRIDADGFAALVTAGDLVLGVVTGVVNNKGINIDPDAATTPDTFTMGSANETAGVASQKRVRYIPALADYLFYNDADSALSQALLMTYMNVNDENDVDPGSTSDSTLSTVRLIEIDPDNDGDTSKGLFQIVESFWAQNCMGTVDTGGIEAS
jgi:hypothetical protein